MALDAPAANVGGAWANEAVTAIAACDASALAANGGGSAAREFAVAAALAGWDALVPACHRSVQNRPVIIESKPATFMVIRRFEDGWQAVSV